MIALARSFERSIDPLRKVPTCPIIRAEATRSPRHRKVEHRNMGTPSADIKRINKKDKTILESWDTQDKSIHAWLTLWANIALAVAVQGDVFLSMLVAEKVRLDHQDDEMEVTPKHKHYKALMKNMSKWHMAGQLVVALSKSSDAKKPTKKQIEKAVKLVVFHCPVGVQKPYEPLARVRQLLLNADKKKINFGKVQKLRKAMEDQQKLNKSIGHPRALRPLLKDDADARRWILGIATDTIKEDDKGKMKLDFQSKTFKKALADHKLTKLQRKANPDGVPTKEEREEEQKKQAKKAEDALNAELKKIKDDNERIAPIVANLEAGAIALKADARVIGDAEFKALENAVDKILKALEDAKPMRKVS